MYFWQSVAQLETFAVGGMRGRRREEGWQCEARGEGWLSKRALDGALYCNFPTRPAPHVQLVATQVFSAVLASFHQVRGGAKETVLVL